MNERLTLAGKERIGFTIATTLIALGATACGGGGEQTAKATEATSVPTVTKTTEAAPVPCVDQGKTMLLETDPFCKPATSEQLQWTLTAEKNGWTLPDPLATFETQQALKIDTNNPIKIPSKYTSFEDYHKLFHVLDFETGGKKIANIDNVNTSFNLVANNANILLNLANQYKAGTAPAAHTNVYNEMFAESGILDAFVTLLGPESAYNPDPSGKDLLVARLKEIVATTTPNQVIEILPAERGSTTTTSFSDIKNLPISGADEQQVELTGSVKLKITTRTTSPDGIIVTEEVTDLLHPGETLVIHRTNSAGITKLYTTDRWVIHTTAAPTQ